MRHIKFFLWLLPSVLLPGAFDKNLERSNVLFCYGKFNTDIVKNYDYLILESLNFTSAEVKKLNRQNKNVLAYISLGEVNSHDFFSEIMKQIAILKQRGRKITTIYSNDIFTVYEIVNKPNESRINDLIFKI